MGHDFRRLTSPQTLLDDIANPRSKLRRPEALYNPRMMLRSAKGWMGGVFELGWYQVPTLGVHALRQGIPDFQGVQTDRIQKRPLIGRRSLIFFTGVLSSGLVPGIVVNGRFVGLAKSASRRWPAPSGRSR